MKKTRKFLLIIFLLILLICAAAFLYLKESLSPVSKAEDKAIFTIEKNTYGKDVFMSLADEGFIKDGKIAYYYSRFKLEPDFKAGSYEIDKSWELEDIVEYLSDSSNAIINAVNITFYEGDWLKDYARYLSENTNLDYEDILSAWSDENYIRSLMADYPFLTEDIFNENVRYPLEGYLFPDTYEIYRETTIDEVTRKLLNQTKKIYDKYEEQFNNCELSINEVFALASIVQYEASNYEDMQMVASVFYNRLHINMRLQSSATICYAIDLDVDDDWVECETNADYDSPYNTYLYFGITPGPIVAPGEAAIRAVLEPAETDYLYFIGDACGDHSVYFSETYAQHQALVEQYLWCY